MLAIHLNKNEEDKTSASEHWKWCISQKSRGTNVRKSKCLEKEH